MASDEGHPERVARIQRRIAKLESQRLKLVQMAYADAIPMDLLKQKQERIGREQAAAEGEIKKLEGHGQDVITTYNRARALMERATETYRLGGPDVRRHLVRAFLSTILVDTDDEQATLASPWAEIQAAATHVRQASQPTAPRSGHDLVRRPSTTNPDPSF